MTVQTTALATHEEYFNLLAKSDIKLEYNAGEIVAMPGSQPVHNLIAVNLICKLGYCLKSEGCVLFNSDQLIRVEDYDKFTFPDIVIACQKPVYKKSPGGLDALLNPDIIIEVLSPSTESYDRLEKFDCYKKIASFTEYVLVSSTQKKVEVIKKLSEAEWLSHTYYDGDDRVLVETCQILMADIYLNTEFA